MNAPLRRVSLLVIGAGAAGLGLGVDLGSGWLQLLAVALGGAGILAAIPAVSGAVARTLARSAAESAAVLARLHARPASVLRYALWFALVASAGEAAYRSYQQSSGTRVLSPEYFWRIPLANLLTFGAVGVLVFLMARWKRHWPWFAATVGTFAFMTTAAVLFLVGDLHDLAAAAVAGGFAVQMGRLAASHTALVETAIRRTLLPMAVLVLGVAVGVSVWPHWREHRALAALPPAPASRPPDVLLIVLDTVRAKSLSLHGYGRRTSPRLDAFAARGVTFDRAFATSPWTLPTHGSLFTGRWPHELGGGFMSPLDDRHPTLAEALGRHGYVTAAFVANRIYGAAEFGLARGFVHYEDDGLSPFTALTGASFPGVLAGASGVPRRLANHENLGTKSAAQVNRDYLRWRDARRDGRPSFVFLNYYDAHAPYFSPDEFARQFSAPPPQGDVWARPLDAWSPEEIRALNDAYDGTIAYLDHHVGELLATLERDGTLARTVVIITSDHGEQFGEHGLLEHANSLYLPLLHVPLVVVYPAGVPAGQRREAPVTLRDVPATVFDLAGVADPRFPGRSLRRVWSSADARDEALLAETQQAYPAYPDHYPARRGPMTSVIAGGMHYIRHQRDGREELYDLTRDPDELVDVAAADAARIERYRTLWQQLREDSAGDETDGVAPVVTGP